MSRLVMSEDANNNKVLVIKNLMVISFDGYDLIYTDKTRQCKYNLLCGRYNGCTMNIDGLHIRSSAGYGAHQYQEGKAMTLDLHWAVFDEIRVQIQAQFEKAKIKLLETKKYTYENIDLSLTEDAINSITINNQIINDTFYIVDATRLDWKCYLLVGTKRFFIINYSQSTTSSQESIDRSSFYLPLPAIQFLYALLQSH